MNKKLIVGYCRLSRDDSNDTSTSIINQKTIINKWANENNLKVDRFYCDDGFTGINFDRPDMKRLIADLNDNKISTIIVKDYSRIGRKGTKVQEFVESLLLSNVRLISINDNYDSLNGEDDFLPIKAWMNEMYVKDVSKKVKQSFQSMSKKGELIINVPYGYVKDPFVKSKYYKDELCAKYVPMIFNWYIEGCGMCRIANKLDEIGAPTSTMIQARRKEMMGLTYKGKVCYHWNAASVSVILKNEFYIGTLCLGKTKSRQIKKKSQPVSKDQWYVFENAHEPLIDKNTFEIAQEIATKRKQHPYRGMKNLNQKYPNVFVGFLKCADCGLNLTSTRRRNGDTRYLCRSYHDKGLKVCTPHAVIDPDIKGVLLEYLRMSRDKLKTTIDSLDDIIKNDISNSDDKFHSVEQLEKELLKANNDLKIIFTQRIQDKSANPNMADIIDQTYNSMQEDKMKLIKSLEIQIKDLKELDKGKDEIKENLTTALSVFDDILKGDNITKKQLSTILDKIIVYEDGDLDIYLKGDLHKILFPSGNNVVLMAKVKKLTKRHKEILGATLEYFDSTNGLLVSPTTARKFLATKNIGIPYSTMVSLFYKLRDDGYIVKNDGYNKGFRLLKTTNDIKNDYFSYTSCLGNSRFSNNKDNLDPQPMNLDTIMIVNSWIRNNTINKKG
mgnify:FL=1